MNKANGMILLFIFSVLISSISQVLLKQSASKTYDNAINEYLNIKVISAYIMFFSSTLITVLAYKIIPLSLGPVLESSGYIFISLLSVIFLKEKITLNKLMGMVLIILGIIVCSI